MQQESDTFSALVNPGVPIPAASTAIHTITDTDVANAERFSTVFPQFSEWVGGDVVLGYSIGFDLAVLKAEHDRSTLAWQAPRCLDVRHLIELIAPELPNYSLDVVSAWLNLLSTLAIVRLVMPRPQLLYLRP